MIDLTKIYIDLSKCSVEERKSIPQILEKAGEVIGENILFESNDFSYWTNLHKPSYATYWTVGTPNSTPDKTELTYPEFIKLLEGGEEEKESIDYKSEFEKLKSLVMSDSVFWCLRYGVKYPSDFEFEDNGYIELYDWIKVNSNQ